MRDTRCGVLLKAYREFEGRVGLLAGGRGAKTAAIERFIAERVGDEFTIGDVRDGAPGASDSLIGKVLARLRDEGRIEPLGTGRSARWRRLATNQTERPDSGLFQMVRGEIFRLPAPRAARGHEQQSARFGVVVQADELLGLSTALVAPTSTRALAASFRPLIRIDGIETRVLVEQTSAVDARRLGASAGRLGSGELLAVDEALRLVLAL